MTSDATTVAERRAAKAVGLSPDTYISLRKLLSQGEDLTWLRCGHPQFAGMFPDALGFALLCERLASEEALERRCSNLRVEVEKEGKADLLKVLNEAADEGELEDVSLALSRQPAEESEGEGDALEAYAAAVAGNIELAAALRTAFRTHASLAVAVKSSPESDEEKKGKKRSRGGRLEQFRRLDGFTKPLPAVAAQDYLLIRQGEHAHALEVSIELAPATLRELFEKHQDGVPPQEVDRYYERFVSFFLEERQPRFVQEARAQLKRLAENDCLQRGWRHLDGVVRRGVASVATLGVAASRPGRVSIALLNDEGTILRGGDLSGKSDKLEEEIGLFLGEVSLGLVAIQADAQSRQAANGILALFRGKEKPRSLVVPSGAVRTLTRECAQRPDEAQLTIGQRHAALAARFAFDPRATTFHTPHIIRAFVPFRSEINAHRLDIFEGIYLSDLLAERGVDVNRCSRDELRLVPGVPAEMVLTERRTGPFRSLLDVRDRLGLDARRFHAAAAFLRVRGGDQPLDARPLHPVYYAAVSQLAEEAGTSEREILRHPEKTKAFAWDDLLKARSWPESVPDAVRRGLNARRGRPRTHTTPSQRLESLQIGTMIQGKVSNLTQYGAFIDIGLRREGLLHISEMGDDFVKDPSEVLTVGQEVTVRVLSVDLEGRKFRLSMRSPDAERKPRPKRTSRQGATRGGGGRGGRSGGGPRGRGHGGGGGHGRSRLEEHKLPPLSNPFEKFFKANPDTVERPGKADGDE